MTTYLPKSQKTHQDHNFVKYPILSFFTGGGFLDMGFEQAGFDIVWTNEVDPVFARMYTHGTTAWRKSCSPSATAAKISETRSIADLNPQEIVNQAFIDGAPQLFGIIGGPPCIDFSVAGRNQGSKGQHGRLSRVFIDTVCKINPCFFVVENVPNLMISRVHRKFLNELKEYLEAHDFFVDMKLLNALEFGAPQDRNRLFIMGLHKAFIQGYLQLQIDKNNRNWFPWPKPLFKDAKNCFSWPGIVSGSEKPIKPDNVPIELTVHPLLNGSNPPYSQPNGKEGFKPYSLKFTTVREGDTKRRSFKRLHRYRYSPTACYGNNEVHLHPWENRRLTVREAMRIQSIPDSYALPEDISLSAKFAFIGNAVPVKLAHELAKSLKTFIIMNSRLSIQQLGYNHGHLV